MVLLHLIKIDKATFLVILSTNDSVRYHIVHVNSTAILQWPRTEEEAFAANPLKSNFVFITYFLHEIKKSALFLHI